MLIIHIYIFPISFHQVFSSGMYSKWGMEKNSTGIWGNIRHGPYSLTACWAEPFTSERHAAGCGLHRVIAFGFWGIQECISTIINKSALAGCKQLLNPSGDESRQLNSLINVLLLSVMIGMLQNTDSRLCFLFVCLFNYFCSRMHITFNEDIWACCCMKNEAYRLDMYKKKNTKFYEGTREFNTKVRYLMIIRAV